MVNKSTNDNGYYLDAVPKWLLAILIILSTLGLPGTASATGPSVNNFVAFGDSLTDNGTSPSDSYGITTYSNGPVWADYLTGSSLLNVPSLDLAYVGATTGTDNPSAASTFGQQYANTGMLSQVAAYLNLTSSSISSNTLVALWGGADDLFQNRSYSTAISNIATEIQELESAGAKNFLILNLPNIGATPYFQTNEPSEAAAATAWCQAFNSGLASEVSTLEGQEPGDSFYTFDVYDFFNQITADPTAYGFADDSAIYWTDGLHPSTQTHSLIATDIYDQLDSVPEPGSTPLLILGGAGALAIFRRKSTRKGTGASPWT